MKQEINKYLESQTRKTNQEIQMAEFGKKIAICLFMLIGIGIIIATIAVVTILI